MGFGSYDESEQENQDPDASDIEITGDDRSNHDGTVEFSSDEDTEALVDRLDEMKDADSE